MDGVPILDNTAPGRSQSLVSVSTADSSNSASYGVFLWTDVGDGAAAVTQQPVSLPSDLFFPAAENVGFSPVALSSGSQFGVTASYAQRGQTFSEHFYRAVSVGTPLPALQEQEQQSIASSAYDHAPTSTSIRTLSTQEAPVAAVSQSGSPAAAGIEGEEAFLWGSSSGSSNCGSPCSSAGESQAESIVRWAVEISSPHLAHLASQVHVRYRQVSELLWREMPSHLNRMHKHVFSLVFPASLVPDDATGWDLHIQLLDGSGKQVSGACFPERDFLNPQLGEARRLWEQQQQQSRSNRRSPTTVLSAAAEGPTAELCTMVLESDGKKPTGLKLLAKSHQTDSPFRVCITALNGLLRVTSGYVYLWSRSESGQRVRDPRHGQPRRSRARQSPKALHVSRRLHAVPTQVRVVLADYQRLTAEEKTMFREHMSS